MNGKKTNVKSEFKRQSGFTLVEILVVIGIIAILAGLLYPTFVTAKISAKRSVEISNLSNLTKGIFLYEADADDSIPRGTTLSVRNTIKTNGAEYGEPWDSQLKVEPLIVDLLSPYVGSREIFFSPFAGLGIFPVYKDTSFDFDSVGSLYYISATGYPDISNDALWVGNVSNGSENQGGQKVGCAFADGSVRMFQWSDCIESTYDPNCVECHP